MPSLVDKIKELATQCTDAAAQLESPQFKELRQRLARAADAFELAASGSWLGYQSCVYTVGFRPKRPGEHFDLEMGLADYCSSTTGNWQEYDRKEVERAVWDLARASDEEAEALVHTGNKVRKVVEECKADLLAVFEALLHSRNDPRLRELRDRLVKLRAAVSPEDCSAQLVPRRQWMTRDPRALQGPIVAPPHLAVKIWLMSAMVPGESARNLAEIAKDAVRYMEAKAMVTNHPIEKTARSIFLGHGRSEAWKDLRDLIRDRLQLPWEEFNREPQAGRTTTERLLELLDKCSLAFLVMTAEDEAKDGTMSARPNVVHEAGLFQGRHGFERAIILLEDGCQEFSNIAGLCQIRFPKGQILSQSEEIRRVLERERMLPPPNSNPAESG
jgi:predicted nucleotide-binding protein